MITPPFLKKGDTIAIAAPARKITPEQLQPAIDIFKAWGFNVLVPDDIYATENQFAGSDALRTAQLQQLLNNTEVNAIICARGGYGIIRIIDNIDFSAFKASPKWIIGYSDVTIMHSHIQQNLGIETLHAGMPINFAPAATADLYEDTTEATEALIGIKHILTGNTAAYTVSPHPLNRTGQATGILTGGNLSILYSLAGSNSDADTFGKILFIEDIDEYLYHVDRMIYALKRSGKLDNLAGLVVGGFTGMRDNEVPFGRKACEIIADAVKEYDYPVLFDFPAGHIVRNLPLIMGREAVLEVTDESAKLLFKDPQPVSSLKRLRKMIKPALFITAGFVILYLLYSLIVG